MTEAKKAVSLSGFSSKPSLFGVIYSSQTTGSALDIGHIKFLVSEEFGVAS